MTTELQAAAAEIEQNNTGGITYHIVEHYGTCLPVTGITIGEHWRVNGKVFYHKPTDEEVKAAYNKPTKEQKRMTEDELERELMSKAWQEVQMGGAHLLTVEDAMAIAKKYRGES